jgi:hypothetical protein
MHAADVDGDGREEIILGAAVIDDNGKALWNLQMGHPDVCYVTDVIPEQSGAGDRLRFRDGAGEEWFLRRGCEDGKDSLGLRPHDDAHPQPGIAGGH